MHARALPSGARVLWVPAPDNGLAAVSLCFSVGMDTLGNPLEAHLAHFVEHVVAGLAHEPEPDARRAAVRRELEALGVRHNAWTDAARTAYHAWGPAAGVARYVRLLRRALRAPLLSPDAVRTEAAAVATELARADGPGERHRLLVARHEAPASGFAVDARRALPYVHALRDDPSAARRLARAFVARFYRPHRLHVTVACAARDRALLFGALARVVRARASRPTLPAPRPSPPVEGTFVARGAEDQSLVTVHFALALGRAPRDAVVARLCAAGLHATLFDELRAKRRLVYGCSVGVVNAHEHDAPRSVLAVHTRCAHADARRVASLIVDVVRAAPQRIDRESARVAAVAAAACATPESLLRFERRSVAGLELATDAQTARLIARAPRAAVAAAYDALRAAPVAAYITTS
jgi:predicted Zn-dependent peptidase